MTTWGAVHSLARSRGEETIPDIPPGCLVQRRTNRTKQVINIHGSWEGDDCRTTEIAVRLVLQLYRATLFVDGFTGK